MAQAAARKGAKKQRARRPDQKEIEKRQKSVEQILDAIFGRGGSATSQTR